MKRKVIEMKITTSLLIFALLLSACAAGAPGPKLEGTTWELVSLDGKLAMADTTVTLIFEDGQAGGNAGCNSYGASYEVQGETLTLGELMSTMMYCEADGVMEQETDYLIALSQVKTYTIIDGALYLSKADGRELKFIPQK